jgi:putative phosphoribosyl transferase
MNNEPLFRDRIDAGRVLADRLTAYQDQHAVVLGIPRGGVPVAAEVARRLDADLDIVVARKLGAPMQPELALGAVTADGETFLNKDLIALTGTTPEFLEAVTVAETAEARSREQRLRGGRFPVPVTGRVAILVDDGLATGATMRAAVRAVRKQEPAKLVVAVPVGSPAACAAVRREADDLVCPHEPDVFGAVGWFYEHFEPVDDVEVQRILAEALIERERTARIAATASSP